MVIAKSTLDITHFYIKSLLKHGDIAVDATMGNGNDTLFLAKLVGDSGMVYAFDIQKKALENTTELLTKHNLVHRTKLICDGHQKMANYISRPVNAIMFNLGYLPGGDHNIATRCDSTIAGVESAKTLLVPGGLISLAVYYGGDSGFEEKNAVMEYIKTIDYRKFTVLVHDYVNRPNCPPIAVMIEKT